MPPIHTVTERSVDVTVVTWVKPQMVGRRGGVNSSPTAGAHDLPFDSKGIRKLTFKPFFIATMMELS